MILNTDDLAAEPPCEEGRTVPIECTPVCQDGYSASIPKLLCRDNVLYPPTFECNPEFTNMCEVMMYVSFGISGLWVLILVCLLIIAKEKATARHFNVKKEMKNYNRYVPSAKAKSRVRPIDAADADMAEDGGLEAIGATAEELEELTPRSRAKRIEALEDRVKQIEASRGALALEDTAKTVTTVDGAVGSGARIVAEIQVFLPSYCAAGYVES